MTPNHSLIFSKDSKWREEEGRSAHHPKKTRKKDVKLLKRNLLFTAKFHGGKRAKREPGGEGDKQEIGNPLRKNERLLEKQRSIRWT